MTTYVKQWDVILSLLICQCSVHNTTDKNGRNWKTTAFSTLWHAKILIFIAFSWLVKLVVNWCNSKASDWFYRKKSLIGSTLITSIRPKRHIVSSSWDMRSLYRAQCSANLWGKQCMPMRWLREKTRPNFVRIQVNSHLLVQTLSLLPCCPFCFLLELDSSCQEIWPLDLARRSLLVWIHLD